LDSRIAIRGLLIGLGLLLILDALAVRLGVAPGALPTLDGPAPWLISRAAGASALLALTLDVIFGLLVSSGVGDRWLPRARSVDAHRWLSSVTLALVAVHAGVLVIDGVVRFDVLDALVPFLSSYRSLAVGVGVLAAYGALVVHVSFELRKRIGARTWRKLHHLSFAVFVAAVAHGVAAGGGGLRPLYLAAAAAVAVLLSARVASAASVSLRRRQARTAARPGSPR
jgi:predicted ferric reductase